MSQEAESPVADKEPAAEPKPVESDPKPVESTPKPKKMGRPVGAKDKAPRKKPQIRVVPLKDPVAKQDPVEAKQEPVAAKQEPVAAKRRQVPTETRARSQSSSSSVSSVAPPSPRTLRRWHASEHLRLGRMEDQKRRERLHDRMMHCTMAANIF